MTSEEKKLRKRLARVEAELGKTRTSVLQDGWQTQRFARKSRKWDELAKEKFELLEKLEQFHDGKANGKPSS